MTHPQTQDDEALEHVERYEFTNGWTMRRSAFHPFNWLLFDTERYVVGEDRYRHDLMQRHNLKVARYREAALTALRNHEGRK